MLQDFRVIESQRDRHARALRSAQSPCRGGRKPPSPFGWVLEEASPPKIGTKALRGYAPQSCDRILLALPDQQMSRLLSGDRMQIVWHKESHSSL